MNSLPSISPLRAGLAYVGLVLGAWAIALLPGPLSHVSQGWPLIVALPWSLFLLQSGIFGGPFGLFLTFLAGMLNGGFLCIIIALLRSPLKGRRRPLLLPPAA